MSDWGMDWHLADPIAVQPSLRLIIDVLLQLNDNSTATQCYKNGFKDAITAMEKFACIPTAEELKEWHTRRQQKQRDEMRAQFAFKEFRK